MLDNTPSESSSDLDFFYQIEEYINDTYKNTFLTPESNIKFDFIHHVNGLTCPIGMPIIDDNADTGIACLSLLDRCLFSEKEYPGTFWRELYHLITNDELDTWQLFGPSKMFINFIAFMMRFHETYPNTLPDIIHSTYEMHRAGRFESERPKADPMLIHQVYNTNIITRIGAMDHDVPDPADPINFEDIDLRFLDDL